MVPCSLLRYLRVLICRGLRVQKSYLTCCIRCYIPFQVLILAWIRSRYFWGCLTRLRLSFLWFSSFSLVQSFRFCWCSPSIIWSILVEIFWCRSRPVECGSHWSRHFIYGRYKLSCSGSIQSTTISILSNSFLHNSWLLDWNSRFVLDSLRSALYRWSHLSKTTDLFLRDLKFFICLLILSSYWS